MEYFVPRGQIYQSPQEIIFEKRASLEESDGQFQSRLSQIRTERFDSDFKSENTNLSGVREQIKNVEVSKQSESSLRQSKGLTNVKNLQEELRKLKERMDKLTNKVKPEPLTEPKLNFSPQNFDKQYEPSNAKSEEHANDERFKTEESTQQLFGDELSQASSTKFELKRQTEN